jgi:hypothetical protein
MVKKLIFGNEEFTQPKIQSVTLTLRVAYGGSNALSASFSQLRKGCVEGDSTLKRSVVALLLAD